MTLARTHSALRGPVLLGHIKKEWQIMAVFLQFHAQTHTGAYSCLLLVDLDTWRAVGSHARSSIFRIDNLFE